MLVCFYQVIYAYSLPTYAFPEGSLIQEGLSRNLERRLLTLLSGIAMHMERTIDTPPNFSECDLRDVERPDNSCIRHQS